MSEDPPEWAEGLPPGPDSGNSREQVTAWQIWRGGGPAGEGVSVRHVPTPFPLRPIYMLCEGSSFIRLYPEQIASVHSCGRKVELYLPQGCRKVRHTLQEFLGMMPADLLVQVNDHQAVNLHQVHRVGTDVVEAAGRSFALQQAFRQELLRGLGVAAAKRAASAPRFMRLVDRFRCFMYKLAART